MTRHLIMLRYWTQALPTGTFKVRIWPRESGGGSLGRPRWVAYGEWCGSPVVREAKGIVLSAWTLARGRGVQRLRCQEIADGKYRAPDPWYCLKGSILVRRLSPNNRKLEFRDKKAGRKDVDRFVSRKILHLMGRDLAAAHRGTANHSEAIAHDLAQRARGHDWLTAAVKSATRFVTNEQVMYKEDRANRRHDNRHIRLLVPAD